MSAPANVIQIKDRRAMDETKQATRDYFDYKRLLRKVLTPSEYLVFESLVDAASEKNDGWCWPSLTAIGKLAGDMSRATVVKALKSLEAYGVIQVQHSRHVEGNKPNYYRPMKEPEGGIIDLLGKEWEKQQGGRVKGSLKIKLPQEKVSRGKKTTTDSSLENELPEKAGKGSIKNELQVVQKLNSNVSNTTEPNINGASAPLTRQDEPLIEILERKYSQAQAGNGPRKNKSQDVAAVIAEAFETTFRKPADIPRLQKMARDLNSGWVLIQRILNCTGQKVHDDPHDYLQKAISRERNGQKQANNPAPASVIPPELQEKFNRKMARAERVGG